MDAPLISIAMPSYNQGTFIESSVGSVLKQDYQHVELIVQDGGSADSTIYVLEQVSLNDTRLQLASKRDAGPADAINKAFSKVRGEIIGWLNSDDLYCADTIAKVVQAFDQNPDWIMCYGHGEHIDAFDKVLGRYPTQKPEVGLDGFSSGCFICQPTVFFKTPMLTLLGNLDASLKTAFDYDFWMRAFKAFPDRIGFIDDVLAQSRLHEDCITQRMRETVALEGLALGQRHLGRAQMHWAVTYLEELRRELPRGSEDFQARATEFLEQAGQYLAAAELNTLRAAVLVP